MKIRDICIFFIIFLTAIIISILIHELGHCIFYWIQGIPASLSLTKEYPLQDISVQNYRIGSLGGPVTNIIQVITALILLQKYKGKLILNMVFTSFLLANIYYFLLRSLIAVLKHDGGELEDAANLFGFNYWLFIIIFLTVAIIIMYIWLKRDSIKINYKSIFRFTGLFITFVVIVFILESLDKKYFWTKFPKIEIEDGRVYHDPEKYIK
jgi:hypothetical protein